MLKINDTLLKKNNTTTQSLEENTAIGQKKALEKAKVFIPLWTILAQTHRRKEEPSIRSNSPTIIVHTNQLK